MGEKMTLEQVRDAMIEEKAWARGAGWPMAAGTLQRWADAIDAHLTQPAQAVDVDSIVIGAAEAYLRVSRSGGMPKDQYEKIIGAIRDMARLKYFRLAMAEAAIPNANGKEGVGHG